MANVRLDWNATNQISAYALAYYTGRQYYSGFRNGAVRTREREASTTFDVGINFTINEHFSLKAAVLNLTDKIVPVDDRGRRSEEHRSELQSLMRISYAVFCLKKKKKRV